MKTKTTTRYRFCLEVLCLLLPLSDGFSMDEAMSCDRLYESRRRSARLLDEIPCDMTKRSFCEHKGSAYPENAIWRFKEENRALMRRLYGDMESNDVYREMRSAIAKTSEDSHTSRSRRPEEASRSGPVMMPSLFSNLQYNIRLGSGVATVQSAKSPIMSQELLGGRIRVRKKVKRKKQPTTTATSQYDVEDEDVTDEDIELILLDAGGEEVKVETSTTKSTSTVYTTTSSSEAPTPTTFAPMPTTFVNERPQTTHHPTTVVPTMVTTNPAGIITEEAVTAMNVEPREGQQPHHSLTTATATYNKGGILSTLPNTMILEDKVDANGSGGSSGSKPVTATTVDNLDTTLSELLADVDFDSLEQIMGDLLPGTTISNDHLTADGAGYLELTTDDSNGNSDAIRQPVEQKPQQSKPLVNNLVPDTLDYSGPSMNACPVEEEVFSPYWANNTKGVTLALLNIYPFEQFVHMEMCKYEHEEMLCKKGCRCEQQYRIHRLLAFDPTNECRGIFSDWFQFPSFCVCKCYNVADDFIPKNRKSKTGLDANMSPLGQSSGKKQSRGIQNIPAFLPYEAKQALLLELQQKQRERGRMHKTLDKKHEDEVDPSDTNEVETILENDGEENLWVSKSRTNVSSGLALDEGKNAREDDTDTGDNSDEDIAATPEDDDEEENLHFLYGNVPVMEFKLPDGSVGTVKKTPRR